MLQAYHGIADICATQWDVVNIIIEWSFIIIIRISSAKSVVLCKLHKLENPDWMQICLSPAFDVFPCFVIVFLLSSVLDIW